jgi:hypothetical protein
MKNKEILEEAAKKSFGEIWASLTTEQSEYLKGYIDRQIDMAKRRQAERMYSEEDMIEFAFNTYHYISELMGVPFNLMSENKLHAMYNFEQFKKK